MSLLARLIEAGTPADLVAEVAEELARAKVSQEAIEARREKDRERQQRRRDAHADNVTSRDIADVTTEQEQSPPSLSPNEYISNPHTHPPVTQTPARARQDDFPCPDWADGEVWRDLKRNRRTKKLTNTPTAHKRFISAIEGMADDDWPPGRLIEEIVAKGWGGPHDPRENRKQQNDRTQRKQNSNSNTANLVMQKLEQARLAQSNA